MTTPVPPGDDAASPVTPGHAPLGRGELQDRAIKGAMWTVIHTLVSLPIAFAVNIVIARVLGVVDYGRLAYLTTVMGVAGGIVSLGIGTGLVQFGAKAHAAGRTEAVKQLLSRTQGFRLMVVAPALTLVVISIARVELPLLIIAVVFGVLVPASLAGAAACLTIENKTDAGAKNAMVVNVLTQIAVLAAVFTLGTADSIWAARLVVGGAAVALTMIYISPAYRRAVLRPALPRRFPPGFWRFAVPAGAAGLVGTLVVSRTEVLVLTWMSAAEAAGVFALAFGLAGHIFAPAQALLGPLVPAVSGLREVDEDAVARALTRTLRASSTVVALLVAGALPAFAVLVPTIYGREYDAVPPVLIALGIAGGVLIIAGPVHAFVQARLLGGLLLRVNVLALAANVVLAVVLIPLFGLWGAVIANISAAILQLLLLLGTEVRALGLPWSEAVRSTIPSGVGAIACLSGWSTATASSLAPVVGSLLAGAVGLGVVILGLWVLRTGITSDDSAAILRPLPSWLRTAARPVLRACTHRRVA